MNGWCQGAGTVRLGHTGPAMLRSGTITCLHTDSDLLPPPLHPPEQLGSARMTGLSQAV